MAGVLAPEALVEGMLGALGVLVQGLRCALVAFFAEPGFEQAEGIIPECVDLNGFPSAWCHDPVFDLRVHPRELVTFGTLTQERVLRIDANAEAGAADMALDDFDELGKDEAEGGAVVGAFQITVDRVKKPERRVRGMVE